MGCDSVKVMSSNNTIELTADMFNAYATEAGGRHKGFVLARLNGFNNKQIAEAAGNAGGAPTIAFALSRLRNKYGVDGRNDRDNVLLGEALGLSVEATVEEVIEA